MIRIGICDDEKIFLNTYVEIINNIKRFNSYNIDICLFTSGEELIKYSTMNDEKFDIIFLDIIMGQLNGIETARKIKAIDENTDIVFLTSSKEYALEGYEVRPFNYIIKNSDNMEEKIYEAIRHSYNSRNDYIIINNKSCIEKVQIKKIIYIESNKRKIIINTTDAKYEIYEKLDNIYERIVEFGFVKSHRSYIVNMDFIKRIDPKDIVTTKEDLIPISRGKVEEVKSKFMKYLECSC